MSTVFEEWEMRCPNCSKDDGLQIAGRTWMNLTPDGTELIDGDHEWDDSLCQCNHCDWSGTVLQAEGE